MTDLAIIHRGSEKVNKEDRRKNHHGRPNLQTLRNSYFDYTPNMLIGCHILETSAIVYAVSAEALLHVTDYYHRFDFERTRYPKRLQFYCSQPSHSS